VQCALTTFRRCSRWHSRRMVPAWLRQLRHAWCRWSGWGGSVGNLLVSLCTAVEVADALALFVATAAHALAMSSEALEDSNVPEESFLGDGRDAAAGVTVVAFVLTLCLHVKVLLWGHNGAGRRFTKACAAHVWTLTTSLVQMWDAATSKASTKSSGEGVDLRPSDSAHDETAFSAQESSNTSAAQTAEGNATKVELTTPSVDSTTSSSNSKASSEPHLTSKAQEKVDTLLVRRMSLDLRGNASFAVELEVRNKRVTRKGLCIVF